MMLFSICWDFSEDTVRGKIVCQRNVFLGRLKKKIAHDALLDFQGFLGR